MRLCCRWVLTCIYAVDGNAITYEASGNPTSYYNGYTMTWVEGRKLDTVTVNGQTYTYVYNSDGQRVKKINPDGSYIEYYVMDGTTVGESHFTATGNKTLGIRYTLDENSNVIGFTTGGQNYYFIKNLQSDVLAVYRDADNAVVAEYTYDSWGNILTATGTLAETNPFRYRGYYYDEETDFYYLQSRYYDVAIGRFINADVFASTGQGIVGNNMYTYCNNNAIINTDPSGEFSLIAIGVAALIGGTVSAISTFVTGGSTKEVAQSFVGGACESAFLSVFPSFKYFTALYHFAETMEKCCDAGMSFSEGAACGTFSAVMSFGLPGVGDDYADMAVDMTFGLAQTMCTDATIEGIARKSEQSKNHFISSRTWSTSNTNEYRRQTRSLWNTPEQRLTTV